MLLQVDYPARALVSVEDAAKHFAYSVQVRHDDVHRGVCSVGGFARARLVLALVSWIMKSPPSISDRKNRQQAVLMMMYYRNEMWMTKSTYLVQSAIHPIVRPAQ